MNNFTKNIQAIYGNAGLTWINNIPTIVKELQKKWHLEQIEPISNLTHNYVLRAYQTTTQRNVICKISFELKDLLQEHQALLFYNGNGNCKVYDLDTKLNAMLLEQLKPGTALTSLCFDQDDAATMHAATVAKKLHELPLPKDHNFQHIKEWLQLLYTLQTTAIPQHHLRKAQQISGELLAQSTNEVLLHGDLHHDNIILGTNGWTAIDPKGIIGEPAWEVEPMITNPEKFVRNNNPKEIIKRRLDILATELTIEKQKLIKVCYVRSVLSTCWTVENKPHADHSNRLLMLEADIFEGML